jgi:hypothetical protein
MHDTSRCTFDIYKYVSEQLLCVFSSFMPSSWSCTPRFKTYYIITDYIYYCILAASEKHVGFRKTDMHFCMLEHSYPFSACTHTTSVVATPWEVIRAGYVVQEEHHTTLYRENVGALTCTTSDEIRLKWCCEAVTVFSNTVMHMHSYSPVPHVYTLCLLMACT